MPTILQLTALRPEAQAALDAGYSMQRGDPAAADDPWVKANGASVDAVVTGGHIGISPGLMAALPNLKLIAINGVGYDRVDLDQARSRGIRVTNTPDVLTDDVADLAIGLTLALLRRLPHAHAHVQGGHWPKGDMPLSTKMSGKRFGIFGLGRIGLAVARRLEGFGGSIGYTNRTPRDVPYTRYPDAKALAAASDVLIVCAAASADTRKLIDAEVLAALGPNGYLVNIARGSIVDEPALVAALTENRIAGAALDVFEDEPNVPAAMLTMPHVIVTPHIASGTHETRQAMAQLMLDNVAAFFAGKPLLTPVV